MKKINLVLFYILSFTWGLLFSTVGAFVILALMLTGHKPKVFHGRIYCEVGKGWGGAEFGCFFVVCKDADDFLKRHEAGHGIQNIIFGPLTPFLISIPSAIRYWHRELKYHRKGLNPKTAYYDIWFEDQATTFGYLYV